MIVHAIWFFIVGFLFAEVWKAHAQPMGKNYVYPAVLFFWWIIIPVVIARAYKSGG